MNRSISRYWRRLLVIILLSLTGCVTAPIPAPMETPRYYQPVQNGQLLNRLAPALWVEKYQIDYNRPGAVRAISPDHITIDPDTPVMYAEERHFSTAKGNYTNLLYRVHFKKIPSEWSPYYIGAGKNVGLFMILTLDAAGEPLLLTTVHTCGCYLAFIPTSNLPPEDLPKGWNSAERQTVYGENLPSKLNYSGASPEQGRIQVRLRPDTHRVMDVWLGPTGATAEDTVSIALRPLDELKHLPLKDGGTTSFYVSSGSRAGHVKGSFKSRERLWMSWWSFAWTIGQDKYLGENKKDGPVFFTSLKPWARDASDLRDFAGFLRYWGWNL